MFKRNNYFFTEVNYKYFYNNLFFNIFNRKFNIYNVKLFRIKLLFLYKHIPSDDFDLMRLYNNFMLIWLIFGQKFYIKNYMSSFRLNVYYKRAEIYSFLSKGNFFLFLDIFINGFLPLIRIVSIKIVFFNEKLVINVSDFMFFVSTKVGDFFYIENIFDKLCNEFLIDSSFLKFNNIVLNKSYFSLFKFYGI